MNSRKLRVFKKGIVGVVKKVWQHDHVEFFSKKLKCQGQLLTVFSAPLKKKINWKMRSSHHPLQRVSMIDVLFTKVE